jgi:hypothetical protein
MRGCGGRTQSRHHLLNGTYYSNIELFIGTKTVTKVLPAPAGTDEPKMTKFSFYIHAVFIALCQVHRLESGKRLDLWNCVATQASAVTGE